MLNKVRLKKSFVKTGTRGVTKDVSFVNWFYFIPSDHQKRCFER